VSDNNPLGYDSLKLRAIFIPEGNPNNVTMADITNHLGVVTQFEIGGCLTGQPLSARDVYRRLTWN